MTNNNHSLNSSLKNKQAAAQSKIKSLIFILEILLVTVLLIVWISSKSLQQSKSLWVLFFYCFPAEFLIAVVPHEPILLYFGKFYSPLTVALVASVGTMLTEMLNYSVFKFVMDMKIFQKIQQKKAVNKIVNLFNKSPFLALWIAGFTPVPFYPFRFLVVMARYPLSHYILAVFLSRTPRFFLLAWAGHAINIPDYLLVALFAILILSMNYAFLKNYIKRRRERKKDLS
ncbi:MAG: YqaA family protein [Candidatus Aminicenantales bacterium]